MGRGASRYGFGAKAPNHFSMPSKILLITAGYSPAGGLPREMSSSQPSENEAIMISNMQVAVEGGEKKLQKMGEKELIDQTTLRSAKSHQFFVKDEILEFCLNSQN
eukprot:gene25319-biopygen10544